MTRVDELRSRWQREPFSRAFLPLAEEYRRLGKLVEAERVAREGLQRHPTYHSAKVLLGRVLLDLDRLEEAAAEFRSVLEAEPRNLLAGRLLAGIQRSQGRWAEALETFRRLQIFYPDDPDVRAQVYQLERGPEEASGTPTPTPSSSAAPPDALATNTLAEIYLGQGLVDRAVGVYENMLRADPDNQALRRRLREIQKGGAVATAAAPDAPKSAAPPADPRQRVILGLQQWLIGIQRG
ncbi:MAG TPA: tetratricopeptide repeat protein [Candidatus Polarisedimenticolia bacterium]|nr:tetratricopeptide repeat protein [Candidatus Polarisedimenticolia bacterium]